MLLAVTPVVFLLVAQPVYASIVDYGNVSIDKLRESVKEVFERVVGRSIGVEEVEKALNNLIRCTTGFTHAVVLFSLARVESGGSPGATLLQAFAWCPWCLRGCNASDVYLALLASVSKRVGSVFMYASGESVKRFVERLGLNRDIVDALAELINLKSEAWALIATLALPVNVDDEFWRLVEESSPRLKCLAVVAARRDLVPRDLIEWLASRHPVESLRGLKTRDRVLCALAYIKLGFKSGNLNESSVGNLDEAFLSYVASVIHGDVEAPPLVKAAEWGLPRLDGFAYEVSCVTRELRGQSLEGEWLACSRDYILANATRENWVVWGYRLYTWRVTDYEVSRLEACAGLSIDDALAAYLNLEPPPGGFNAIGCAARLAAIRSVNDTRLLDWVIVRVAAWNWLSKLGFSNLSLEYPPPDPTLAWVLGFIRTLEPPNVTHALRVVVEAWSLASRVGLYALASRLERIANALAAGNLTLAVREAEELRSMLESMLASTIDPRLVLLASEASSLRLNGTVVVVDYETAARLLSRLLDVDVEVAKAMLRSDVEKLLRLVLEGRLEAKRARSLLNALELPEPLRRALEKLLARIELGDREALSILYKFAYAAGSLKPSAGGIRLPQLPPVDFKRLLPVLGVSTSAALVSYILSRVLHPRLKPSRRARLYGFRLEMAKLLSMLEKRFGTRSPSETLREYSSRLPPHTKTLFMSAVRAYEEARFGSRGFKRAEETIRWVRGRLKRLV